MEHPGFFERAGPFPLARILEASEAEVASGSDTSLEIHDVLPLDEAGARQVSFFDNPKYLSSYTETKAAACFVAEKYADSAPVGLNHVLSRCGSPGRVHADDRYVC